MATNRRRKDGYHLSVACSNPTTPASGDPVRYGALTGVALTDESDAGNPTGYTSVDFGPSVWDVTVDDNEGSGIAIGDDIYYHDTGTGTGSVHLNNTATSNDAYFGIALETVGANATTTIQVLHVPTAARIALASGGVTTGTIAADAVTNAKIADAAVNEENLSTALQGTAEGLGLMHVARVEINPTGVAGDRTIAAHASGVVIPDNAIIVGGFVDVITTFTSATDAATVAIMAQGANDIVSAIAISNGGNPWDAGLHAIVPKANTPESTGIKLTAARDITFTVAVEALTAGLAYAYLYYVNGA